MPKGRHSVVEFKNGVAVKKFKKELKLNFWKEAYFLTILQPFKFVPRLYKVYPEKLEIHMERLEGIPIGKYIENGFDERVLEALKICRILDRLGINKEEMTHPDKHVIIGERVWFIDFERGVLREKPANVTQFSIYLAKKLGKNDWGGLSSLLRNYKRRFDEESFKKILEFFTR
ncbi:conserved hypothetical protein [Ferroglobus placidus DSM 10642]|uniref:Serine/threonine protein kinase n=1 Tax=Ferroglobus placidus (strain DSM 10642 / AEDII12DO) TaxID=589924 RepID=D3S1L1_FERPA|nr:hypothetical protein [Ferroglobus placidus]ADC66475.1 conserved hypothetical protein [Ferroglobus placidus DSM 10642]